MLCSVMGAWGLGTEGLAGLLQIYYSSILGADSTAGLLDNEKLSFDAQSEASLGNDKHKTRDVKYKKKGEWNFSNTL